jgi:hypothetical protein
MDSFGFCCMALVLTLILVLTPWLFFLVLGLSTLGFRFENFWRRGDMLAKEAL